MHKTIFTLALLLTTATTAAAQSPATGQILGHDYVDLGLSVMWATCNIGAETPSDYGDYFAWGEAETKSSYTKDNSATYGKSSDTFLDAASAQWGSSWRMPTRAECQELIDNCTWQWTTVGGHKGYKVTSKKNGNSIFLPAAGCPDTDSSSLLHANDRGWYWSLQTHDSENAYRLFFTNSILNTGYNFMFYGYCVRPITNTK